MLNITITEHTPDNMLRAIRAACNELLGEQTAQAAVLNKDEVLRRESMSQSHAALYAAGGPVKGSRFYRVGEQPSEQTVLAAASDKAVETVGAPAVATAAWDAGIPQAPAAPPLPPAPTAEPILPKIFALITSQIVTINQAVEAAQAEGYADLGANGLGGAPREAQEAVLRKLEG